MNAVPPTGGEPRSYHGQPVIKQPVWTWEIPCYFFTGGLAGASSGLAYLSGLRGDPVLARRAWSAALAGVTISPALLMADLGRPARFLNMLRLLKVTSPMSVGSWVLAGSGLSIGVASVNAWTGMLARPAAVARPLAALLGLPLSTYTAALVANTAVPVWHEARRELPFVFGAGAALSAGAVAVCLTPPRHAAPARRLAVAAAVGELGSKALMHRRLGPLGTPYREGPASTLDGLSQACVAGGALLLAARGRRSRLAAVTAGALMSGGGLCARWSVFKAGFASAADPSYTVAPQRARIDQGQTPGAARRTSRLSSPEPAVGSPATIG
jgi:hypothetical protein